MSRGRCPSSVYIEFRYMLCGSLASRYCNSLVPWRTSWEMRGVDPESGRPDFQAQRIIPQVKPSVKSSSHPGIDSLFGVRATRFTRSKCSTSTVSLPRILSSPCPAAKCNSRKQSASSLDRDSARSALVSKSQRSKLLIPVSAGKATVHSLCTLVQLVYTHQGRLMTCRITRTSVS
jgi:hypothetical protein